VTVLYHGAGDEAGSGPSAVATPAATLALVGNGSAAAGDGDSGAAQLQPALAATDVHADSSPTRDQLDSVALVITHALRELGSDGKLVLRMDGSAVELELKPGT
jgi:hypothetical protein